mgnify:CR=1 FL=1
MKIKRLTYAAIALLSAGVMSTTVNANESDVTVLHPDKKIEILSITKVTNPSSLDQLVKDLKDIFKKEQEIIAQRDFYKKQFDNVQGTISDLEKKIAQEQATVSALAVERANSIGVNALTTQYDSTENSLKNDNRSLESAKQSITSLDEKYKIADLKALESQDYLYDVISRYNVVFASLSEADINNLVENKDIVSNDRKAEFKELLTKSVEKAKEAKRKAEEAAAKAREEQRKADEAKKAKEAEEKAAAQAKASQAGVQGGTSSQGSGKYVVGGDFAPIDPNFQAALNGGYWGNCTYYVYNRVAQLGKPLTTPAMGDAAQWSSTARSIGLPVSHTPKAGTIAVFQPGVAGASPVYGHVSFVEKVYSDGTVLVSEMNVQGLNIISTRLISAADAQYVEYIDVGL